MNLDKRSVKPLHVRGGQATRSSENLHSIFKVDADI